VLRDIQRSETQHEDEQKRCERKTYMSSEASHVRLDDEDIDGGGRIDDELTSLVFLPL
jgi:hypothetical protein